MAANPGTAAPGRRPDASMDLLIQIHNNPVDPDYARVAASGRTPPKLHWTLAIVALIIGAMVTVAAQQNTRAAPGNAAERKELISRIQTAEREQDQLRTQANTLTEQIAQLRAGALGNDTQAKELETKINELNPKVGTVAVSGPGIVIMVDDAPRADAKGKRYQVLDVDLQQLVNGLWAAGAEAISINGHRLSALTAIRGAGDAITVDYRSLTHPYRIEAIGDPDSLQARFVESSGGQWWNSLKQIFSMRYDLAPAKQLTLEADPGMVLRHARKGKS